MRLDTPSADRTIDLSGARCPHLVIAIIAALESMTPGQILQVIATDANAPSSVTAWARQSGHTLHDMYHETDHVVFFLECAGRRANRHAPHQSANPTTH